MSVGVRLVDTACRVRFVGKQCQLGSAYGSFNFDADPDPGSALEKKLIRTQINEEFSNFLC